MKKRIIIEAPFTGQREKYPTGCESVTAVMALNHAGVDIDPDTFIEKYLTKGSMPHEAGGRVIGADPRKAFVGDPYSPDDNGCYAPVIKAAAEKLLKEKAVAGDTIADSLHITDASGSSLGELCSRYIKNGVPVIVWATMYMRHTYTTESAQGVWRAEDDPSRTIRWRSNEHCLLLVGYDRRHYYFNDPLVGAAARFPKAAVQRGYRSLFRQALVISK
jgi:uncharacterized protein YvpB